MITIVALAQKITTLLNTEAWDLSFTATRDYKPIYLRTDLENLLGDNEIKVSVVPNMYDPSLATRSQDWREDKIDIAVIKKIEEATSQRAEKDGLMRLCEQITKFFVRKKVGTSTCRKPTYNPLFVPEQLLLDDIFFGLISLELKGIDS